MKVLVITKKNIALIATIVIFAIVVAYFATIGATVATSIQKRLIPIYNVETDKKQVAITFDAAWGANDTEELIKVLDKYNAKATFFVLGEWVDKYPDKVKKLSDAGHYIASHSNTHDSLANMPKNQVRGQLETCNKKIKKVTGQDNILVRAPSGDYNNNVVEVVNSMDLFLIQWNVDSLDYRGISEDEICRRVTKEIKCGDIVLFHNDVTNTPKALARILEEYKKRGYQMVTVDELIYKDNYKINYAGVQSRDKNMQEKNSME